MWEDSRCDSCERNGEGLLCGVWLESWSMQKKAAARRESCVNQKVGRVGGEAASFSGPPLQ